MLLERVTRQRLGLPWYQMNVQPDGAAPTIEQGDADGETILVVEHDDVMRALMRRSLQAQEHKVLVAADGDGALELLAGEHPIALLVTSMTPGGEIQGSFVIERALESRPGLRVLCLSDHSGNAAHIDRPGVMYLEKPLTVAGITSKVCEVLDGW